MFRNLEKFRLPEIEEKILRFWEDNQIFQKSLRQRMPAAGKKRFKNFVFFEGPPTANGRPGTHHVLARAFKDIILRYRTMRGYLVSRKAGWDTQGLPVEIEVERELKLKTKQDIEKFGIAKFNRRAKKSVWRYKEEWEKLTARIGYWLDFKNAYITYENKYLETLWWIFKQIDKRRLLTKAYRVAPYCPRCQTVLSSHELGQPGAYRLTKDPSIFVKFKIRGKSNEYLLIWTTTPWTLPANAAVAVNPKLEYKKYKIAGGYLWSAIAPPAVGSKPPPAVDKKTGRTLVGWRYSPPYKNKGPHRVYAAEFVSAEEGTGLVHVAPAFGEDDFNLMRNKMKEEDVPITIDDRGRISGKNLPGAGKSAKLADVDIISDLKKRKLLFQEGIIEHEYPFCWRCSEPLLYMARFSWFIKMSKLRSDLRRENEAINWIPAYLKEGRFGKWLAEVKDWAISRDRYWGTPLPIWQCGKCADYLVIGGLDDLQKHAYSGVYRPLDEEGKLDLHRPFIDKIYLKCRRCGARMKRVPEVADVWFDSGAMPFAQWHYPFENKEVVDGVSRRTKKSSGSVQNDSLSASQFPADYICEAIDQTRGWFYTLLAVSALLRRGVPYRNVISLGLLVDKQGQKMSKSKGNAVDPWDLVGKHGADALRWYFYTLNQPGDTKKFDESDLSKRAKKIFSLIYNSYLFWRTYADKSCRPAANFKPKHALDCWITARLKETTAKVAAYLDEYQIYEAAAEIEEMAEDFSRWYIRRSRLRFQRPRDKNDWREASLVLYNVLLTLTKLLAPFTPFFAEALYLSLKEDVGKISVHLEDWPKFDEKPENKKLLRQMEEVRRLASLALAARAVAGVKVRQPLASLKAKAVSLKGEKELLQILADEVNVKRIVLSGKIKGKVELDTKITAALKREGQLREVARLTQGLRQSAGLRPGDKIEIYLQVPAVLKKTVARFEKMLKETVGAEAVKYSRKTKTAAEMTTKMNNKKIWVGIVRYRREE